MSDEAIRLQLDFRGTSGRRCSDIPATGRELDGSSLLRNRGACDTGKNLDFEVVQSQSAEIIRCE
jgi:hypothetical protein